MTDRTRPQSESDHASPSTQSHSPGQLDRRAFFRGATALTVGALGATPAALAQESVEAASTDAPAQLEAQTQKAMRWAGRNPADWVRPRSGADHNVVIVGGGQSGTAIAYALKRKGIGGVDVIDRAAPGETGIWRTIARMRQLRTPKALAGPEHGNPALSFRAWFETLNGPAAFDALDRIPRLTWADYLDWFRQTTDTTVRYGTRLIEIEPQGDLLRLHLEIDGAPRVETARKVVLANGYAGAGGPNIPGFLRTLPSNLWTHTAYAVPFDTMKGKVVGVIGAGASAFDAAAVALESGAAEVHMFNRRPYIDYPAPPSAQSAPPLDRGYSNVLELSYDLPDVVRWRNFLLGDRRVSSVPLDSMQRAVAFRNFHIHLNTSLAEVADAGNGKVSARVGSKKMRLDHLIAGTGYRIDLSAQPELARFHDSIALWGDRFAPQSGEESAAGAAHPYLGSGFEFLPRAGTGAEFLRNIHCFNLAAALSFGIPVGDVPSSVTQPRLVAAVAHDLFVEGVDTAAHERYINAPLAAPDPAPYERAVEKATRNAA